MSFRRHQLLPLMFVALIVVSGCRLPWGTLEFHKNDESTAASQSLTADDAPPFGGEKAQTADAAPGVPSSAPSHPMMSQTNAENAFVEGRRAEDAGELEAARQHYMNVLRNHPQHAQAHHRLGVVSDKLQRFSEAERHYQAALGYLDPENRKAISTVFSDLGYSYLLRGDFQRSERALHNALTYDQTSRIALRNLGLLNGYRGDFQQAYQFFTQTGSATEAQAELDRLFPHWRENAVSQNPAAMSAAQPETMTAQQQQPVQHAQPTQAQPPQYSAEALAASQPPLMQIQEPSPSPSGSQFPTSASLNATQQPYAANGPATSNPQETLMAPPPAQRPNAMTQSTNEYPATGSTPPTPVIPPGSPIAQAEYLPPAGQPQHPSYLPQAAAIHQQNQRHPLNQPQQQQSSETSESARRSALLLGGAIGPGGMFPSLPAEVAQPEPNQLPVNPSSVTIPPPPRQRSLPPVQQIAAEMPNTPPASLNHPYYPPAAEAQNQQQVQQTTHFPDQQLAPRENMIPGQFQPPTHQNSTSNTFPTSSSRSAHPNSYPSQR